jgi:hypothetical protein
MLRHHVNYDNDAPRLIAEELLPILKIDLTIEEVRKLEDFRHDLKSNADDLDDIAMELTDEEPLGAQEAHRRISRIAKNIRAL